MEKNLLPKFYFIKTPEGVISDVYFDYQEAQSVINQFNCLLDGEYSLIEIN